jgi:hypothetical protein
LLNSRSKAAKNAGLSPYQSRAAVHIAAIPEGDFEAAVESPNPPGTMLLQRISQINRPHREKVSSLTAESLNDVTTRVRAASTIEALISLG